MILEKQTEAHILQEGSSQDTIGMSLDLDSAQVLMQMLSKNLYSDAIGSTIRECASNALDSHRRSGCDKPIIVSFKRNIKADTYEFAVEDFGIGLDADDVKNIISKYGKSTKRNSNTELGMMGLGFKAPLAYSSSFYFVCRKDGIERKYMMYEGEDTNSIDLLYETKTHECNGVKVIVPVAYYDRNSFTKKIKEQLAYFESVYFDVDQSIGYAVPNNFVIHRAEHFQFSGLAQNDYMHLCLDNVSYPIDWEKLGIDRIDIPVALRFTLNDGLFPTPNREAIRYTQEAKKTILAKIASVADVFMEKFNESISVKADVKSVLEFYASRKRSIDSFFNSGKDRVDIKELMKYATIPMIQPKIEGIDLLNLERLATKTKDYTLGEYKLKFKFSSGRFTTVKNYYYDCIRTEDLTSYNAGNVYLFSDKLSKGKQDYLRTQIASDNKNHWFCKKETFKLGKYSKTDYKTYYSVLDLGSYPKVQWRQVIKEFQLIVSMIAKDFIDADAINIPQVWIDQQKAKRMKVLSSTTTASGQRKVRLKGEFSGKVGSRLEKSVSDQYCKFVPTTFKLEEAHKLKRLYVYAKEEDRKKMDCLWSAFNEQINLVLVADSTFKTLKEADLHNWITMEKFMEGKNRPFRTMATEFLIQEFIRKHKSTFDRINRVSAVSKDLGDKLTFLENYHNKNQQRYADGDTKKEIIDLATEHNLFDQEIYTIYKGVKEVFTKLPFLNAIMYQLPYSSGNDVDYKDVLNVAIADLFKYHKHKVNLEHYTIKLNEDASLEETLTDESIEQLQTI
jgi:hypothetical protein